MRTLLLALVLLGAASTAHADDPEIIYGYPPPVPVLFGGTGTRSFTAGRCVETYDAGLGVIKFRAAAASCVGGGMGTGVFTVKRGGVTVLSNATELNFSTQFGVTDAGGGVADIVLPTPTPTVTPTPTLSPTPTVTRTPTPTVTRTPVRVVGDCTGGDCFSTNNAQSDCLYFGSDGASHAISVCPPAAVGTSYQIFWPERDGVAAVAATPPLINNSGMLTFDSTLAGATHDGGTTNLTCASSQGAGSFQTMDDGRFCWCDGSAVLRCVEPNVYDVVKLGADKTGVVSSSAAFQAAWTACASVPGKITVPAGTYLLATAVTAAASNCTMECESAGSTIINGAAVSGSNEFLFSNTQNNKVLNCGFTAGPGQALNLTGVRNFEASGNIINMTTGSPAVGRGIFLTGAGVNGLTVTKNLCYGDADGGGQCVSCVRDCNNVTISDNVVRDIYNGFLITSGTLGGEQSDFIHIDRNVCDMGWKYWRTQIRGQGEAVRYSSTTLDDASGAVDFTTLGANAAVRVLPVRTASSAWTTFSPTNKIVDCSAATCTGAGAPCTCCTAAGVGATCGSTNFITAGVLPGDIVYTDTGTCAGGANVGVMCALDAECPSSTCDKLFAKVKAVESAAFLWHRGWTNYRTYLPTAPPPANTTFKVHQLLMGEKTSATTSRITSNFFWHTILGEAVVPADGSMYEATYPHGNYCLQFDASVGVRRGSINGNDFIEPWADGMSIGTQATLAFSDFTVDGNTVTGSQDACITINAGGLTVAHNHLSRCGTYGFAAALDNSTLHDNIVRGGRNTNPTLSTSIVPFSYIGSNTTIHHNKAFREGLCAGGTKQGKPCLVDADCTASTCTLPPLALRGFYIGTGDGTKIDTNEAYGYVNEGLHVAVTATNVIVTGNSFPTGEVYEGVGTYRLDGGTCTFADISALGKYANMGAQSSCECSDCTANTAPCTGSGFGAHVTKNPSFTTCSGPAAPASTPTNVPTPTPTHTATPTASKTATPTGPSATPTLSPTRTPTPTPTSTP